MSERTIKVTLLDGSIVTMNTEERVISYQLAEQMIPLTTDADSVFDDVLAALEEAQQQAKKWEETARTEYEINNKNQDTNIDLRKQLAEAQQTIARQREALIHYAEMVDWEDDSMGDRARAAMEGNKEGSDKP